MTDETATALADAFREHRDAFGVSITIGETEVTAIVNESDFGRELASGGFAQTGDLNAKVLLADLPEAPSIGTAATYRAATYRVQSIATQPGSYITELTLRPGKR